VYTDTDLTKGTNGYGRMYLGELADLPSDSDDPITLDIDTFEVRNFRKTPTIKSDGAERKIWL